MNKATFYRGKSVVRIEWWVNDGNTPAHRWARERVFDDGTADVCWREGTTLHGFSHADHAASYLSEDEYIRFAGLTESDAREIGFDLDVTSLEAPQWADRVDQPFAYHETH